MSVPTNWTGTALKVSDFGVRGSYPSNLVIYKTVRSENLYWRFMPDEADDPRPNKGRNAAGKRLPMQGTTRTTDPYDAARRAKTLANDELKRLQEAASVRSAERHLTLEHYWDQVLAEEEGKTGRRNLVRDIRDLKSNWSRIRERGNGITTKKVDAITYEDHLTLFGALASKSRTGTGAKEDARKVLNKVYKRALLGEFKHWTPPPYPAFSRQKKPRPSLEDTDFNLLVEKVVELSGGNAKRDLTPEEYRDLDWSVTRRIDGYRNWVDLYDALLLQWFFFHRAEDAPRIRGEWYREESPGNWVCFLEEVKKDRPLHENRPYRAEHHRFMQRLKKRKPSGYAVLPHLLRPEGNPNGSHVIETLNHLLKYAASEVRPQICLTNGGLPADKLVWTHIRHTTWRLALRDYPEFGTDANIETFSRNGHTSAKELRDNYLVDIKSERLAEKAREAIPERSWALQKRVSLEDE